MGVGFHTFMGILSESRILTRMSLNTHAEPNTCTVSDLTNTCVLHALWQWGGGALHFTKKRRGDTHVKRWLIWEPEREVDVKKYLNKRITFASSDTGDEPGYSDWLRARQTGRVRVPVRSRFFSSPCIPDRLWGPPSLLYTRGKATGAWSWLLTLQLVLRWTKRA
jgi:hypothetical protein